ncbi:MAG: DUF5684 domain-containing protein [Geobacteraceae bacterium]
MAVLVRNSALIMFVWLMLAGVCFGKQVFMSDGSIIDCQSFWRHGDKVVVKINRDTVLEFVRSEVDTRRTFHKPAKKSRYMRYKKSAAVVPAAAPAIQDVTTQAPSVSQADAATPAENPQPSPVQAPPAAAQTVQPETAQPPLVAPSPVPDRSESATQNQQTGPELLKKKLEAQNSAMSTGTLMTILGVLLAISLLIIISLWVVFTKAGEAGWKSLVPIYNMYILLVISGVPGWWLIMLFIPIIQVVFHVLVMLALAKKFGKGTLFAIGLFLLPMIFYPLLAFGGAQYEQ